MLEQYEMGCPKLKIKSNDCNTGKRILKPGWLLAKKIISDPHPCNKKVIELILTARNGFETKQAKLKEWLYDQTK